MTRVSWSRAFRASTAFKERFGLQNHAGSPAVGGIVDRPMTIMGPSPAKSWIFKSRISRLPGPFDDAFIQRPRKHRGKQGQYINLHRQGAVLSARAGRGFHSSAKSSVQRTPFFWAPTCITDRDGLNGGGRGGR